MELSMPEVREKTERMLRLSEVAARLGVSYGTALLYVHQGILPAIRLGVTIRVHESVVKEILKRGAGASRQTAPRTAAPQVVPQEDKNDNGAGQ